MKICIVSAYFYPVKGGAENHMYFIAQELIKRGHEVEVFVSDSSHEGKIEKKQEVIDKIKVKRFKTWFKISFSGMFFPGLYKAVKNSNADIFHVHGYRHPFNFIFWFTKKPCFMTLHWPVYKGLRSRLLDLSVDIIDKFFGKYILNKFNILCAVSGLEIPWIEKFGINKKKIILTPNCIPKNYLTYANGNAFRKKYDIKDELMVLCVGRIHQTKGFDQVIKIAPYFKDIKFVIVGKDEGFKTELEELVKKLNLNNVIFAGEVSEKEKLQAYNAADIFIHPSHAEAFAIVLLEAMSQKTAVIASNQGGMPWVVDKAGLIFKDNNLNDLRNKLEKLVKNKKLRNELAEKGRKRSEKFTWDKTVDVLEKEYEKWKKKS